MAIDYLPFEPPARSNIRKRLTQMRLDRLDANIAAREASLQDGVDAGMSYDEYRASAVELASAKDARMRLSDSLITIAQQDAAETAYEETLIPLSRDRDRGGFFRTENTRNEAIAGILERERRINSQLSRDQFDRAKAIAAAGLYSRSQEYQLKKQLGVSYVPRAAADISAAALSDPCWDGKRVRREVMFA